jgi:hypothetical protein
MTKVPQSRHCEETKQSRKARVGFAHLDCFVLLAMTGVER